MKKEINNKEKAITLIALIITIIILLILVGITIGTISNGGLFAKAENATNKYKRAQFEELNILDSYSDEIDRNKNLPDVADIANTPILEHKTQQAIIDEGYIPIFTTAQFQSIASEQTNYQILDKNGVIVNSYTMSKNAKYALMNDIDFKSVTNFEPIHSLSGEFSGNGYVISNLSINTDGLTYLYSDQGNAIEMPAAIFDVVYGGNVHDIYVDKSNNEGNRTVSAIIGKATGGTKVNNCYVSNAKLKSTTARGTGAIIGYAQNTTDTIEIKNCKVENSEMYTKDSGSGTGGIIGVSESIINIQGCDAVNLNNSSEIGIRAGIVGYTNQYTEINDCHSQSINTVEAGILGLNGSGNVKIENCTSKGISSKKTGMTVSGITGELLAYGCKGTISNCSVQNITATESGKFSAGIIGIAYINDLNITNCNVKDSKLTNNSAGIVQYTLAKNIIINGCNIENIKFEQMPFSNDKYSKYEQAGIMRISDNSDNIQITNCETKNMTIDSIERVNYAAIISQGGKGTIENCKVYKLINNDKNQVSCLAGGIASIFKGTIKNCEVYDSEIYGDRDWIGGIVGCQQKGDSNSIENCKVYNTSCKVNNSDVGAGGISGLSEVDIKDCVVVNSKIEATTLAGGIFGCAQTSKEVIAKNCKVSDSVISASTQLAGGITGTCEVGSVDSCNIENTEIIGLDDIGGISGGCTKYISNCNVLNCKINATGSNIGGIVGDGNSVWGDSSNFGMTLLKNIVRHTTIAGTSNVNHFIGHNTHKSPTATITNAIASDTVTDCTFEE